MCVGSQLRLVERDAKQMFKVGTHVVFVCEDEALDGKCGVVTGTNRRRVGVEIDDGKGGEKVVGVPASCLRVAGKAAARKGGEIAHARARHCAQWGCCACAHHAAGCNLCSK